MKDFVEKEKLYSMHCVLCEKNLLENKEVLQRAKIKDLFKSAKKQGWEKIKGQWFCPECKKEGITKERLLSKIQRNSAMVKMLEQQLINLIKDSQEAMVHFNKRLMDHGHHNLTGKIYFPDGKKKDNLIIGDKNGKEEN